MLQKTLGYDSQHDNTKRQQVCDRHTLRHRASVVGRRGFVHFGATVDRQKNRTMFFRQEVIKTGLAIDWPLQPNQKADRGRGFAKACRIDKTNADLKSTLFRCADQQSRRGETETGSRFVKATAVILRSMFNRLNRLWFYAASAENTTTTCRQRERRSPTARCVMWTGRPEVSARRARLNRVSLPKLLSVSQRNDLIPASHSFEKHPTRLRVK